MSKDLTNVLIVDDNKGDIVYIRELLSDKYGNSFNLISADSLQSGIKKVHEEAVDVILLDLSLPDSFGVDTVKSLLNEKNDIPVIVMTGIDDERTAIEAMRLGAQDYIVKNSVKENLLRKSILYSIERKKVQKLLEEQKNSLREAYEELRSKSAMLIHAEKMSSIGTLVAGVAHELNNPMMGVINSIQFCLKNTAEDDRRYEILKLAEKATMKCVGIVKDFSTFSRMNNRDNSSVEKTNLNDLINRVLNLLKYNLRKSDVDVRLSVDDDVPDLFVNQNEIQQAILNLIKNCLDALESEPKKEIRIGVTREEGRVKIVVEDNGCGIDSNDCEKIFDPFFSTKPLKKGRGLGLSICKNIIDQHNGDIGFKSEKGKGTQFFITLPIENQWD